jgi:hypothetical protein
MPFEYYNKETFIPPTPLTNVLRDALSVRGVNHMETPFLAIPGSPNSPGIGFQGYTRTGIFTRDGETLSIGLFGFEAFTFGIMSFILKDLYGKTLTLNSETLTDNQTQTFQNASGTIALTSDLGYKETPPTSASDTGRPGQYSYDSDYFYICVGTNTWKRCPILTWI